LKRWLFVSFGWKGALGPNKILLPRLWNETAIAGWRKNSGLNLSSASIPPA